MLTTLPKGSKITIKRDGVNHIITIPYDSPNPIKYLAGFFLLFWLGGWAVGFFSVSKEVLSGQANAFAIFWLGAWTIGAFLLRLHCSEYSSPL